MYSHPKWEEKAERKTGKAPHLEGWKQRKEGSLHLKIESCLGTSQACNSHEIRLDALASVISHKFSSKTTKEAMTVGSLLPAGILPANPWAPKWNRAGHYGPCPHRPQPAFCLWKNFSQRISLGTSLIVQWLRLRPSNAGGTGSIPGQGTKIPHAVSAAIKKKERKSLISEMRKYRNKGNQSNKTK